MKEKKAVEKKNKETNALENIPLNMYTVSGHSNIVTQKILKRYLDCTNHNIEETLDYSDRIEAIQKAPKTDKAKLIEKLFDIEFVDFKMLVSDIAVSVSNDEKLEWIKLGLQSAKPRVWRCACYLLPYLPMVCWDEMAPFIRQKLDYILNNNNENVDDLATGVQTVSFLPEEEQIPIIKKLLIHNNLEIQKCTSWVIKYLSNKSELVEICLTSNNIKVQQSGIDYLDRVNLDNLPKLLEAFNKQLMVNLNNNKDDYESLLIAFSLINRLSQDNKVELVKIGMESSHLDVRENAYQSIPLIPEDKAKELFTVVIKKIINIFNNKQLNQEEIKFVIFACGYLPKQVAKQLLEFGLFQMKKNKIDNNFILLLKVFKAKNKKDLIKLNLPKEFVKDFISNSLYKNYDIDNKNLKRQKFEKTGSKTILLGGKLKDKIIVRYIHPYSFLLWKHLYENHKIWKENGFDYIPIEPIVSYDLCKDNLVRVFSGVLDLNLHDLEGKTSVYNRELYTQREKIIAVLEKENIIHGHCHDKNFVLRFFRKKDGTIDLNKTPRIYLIDLDQADFSYED